MPQLLRLAPLMKYLLDCGVICVGGISRRRGTTAWRRGRLSLSLQSTMRIIAMKSIVVILGPKSAKSDDVSERGSYYPKSME